MAASRLYGKELASLGYGLALWQPEPQLRDGPIMVADVGYVRDGGFRRLFNARAPKGSTINRRGVPVGFRQISLDESEILEIPHHLNAEIYKSESVIRRQVSLGASSDLAASGASCDFSCANEHGAILAFSPAATYQGSDQHDVFKRYYQKNWRSWYHLANERGLGLDPDEIILVYGLHQTASWANACFTSKDKSAGITLNIGVSPIAQAGLSLHGSWSQRTSVEHRSGPAPSICIADGVEGDTSMSALEAADKAAVMNQTVFIKSVHMVTRLGLLKTIRAAAEPGDDIWSDSDDGHTSSGTDLHSIKSDMSGGSSSSDREPVPDLEGGSNAASGDSSDSDIKSLILEDDAIEIRTMPREQRVPLPCDDMLRYILETSTAEYAIACDEDAQTLSRWTSAQDCRLAESSYNVLSARSTLDALRAHRPSVEVVDDGCGMLSIWNLAPGLAFAVTEDECITQDEYQSTVLNSVILSSDAQSSQAITNSDVGAAREPSPSLVPSTSSSEPFYCCGQKFCRRGQFNRHMRSHKDLRECCPYCGYRAAQKSNLDRHINRLHLNIEPYKCRWCSEQFADRSALGKHQKRAHPWGESSLAADTSFKLPAADHPDSPSNTRNSPPGSAELTKSNITAPPPMTLVESSPAAWPNFAFPAADHLDSPSNNRKSPPGPSYITVSNDAVLGGKDSSISPYKKRRHLSG